MMNEKEYITSVVNTWMEKFSDIESIRYAYDEISGFHIVEVSPESIRTDNVDFADEESNLWMNFMELYPDADLLISEPSDVNDMSNIIYVSEKASVSDYTTVFGYDLSGYDESYSFDMSNYSIAA